MYSISSSRSVMCTYVYTENTLSPFSVTVCCRHSCACVPQSQSDMTSESRPPPPPLLKIPVSVHGQEEVGGSAGEPHSPHNPADCQSVAAHSSRPSPTSSPHAQSAPASPQQESSDGRKIIAQLLDK